MSLVSKPGLLNGGLHGQQLLPSSTGDTHCLGSTVTSDFTSKINTENIELKTSDFHNSTDNGDLGQHSLNEGIVEAENTGEESPVIDIIINNVVCTFSTRCYLNLRAIALKGTNVEYKRENGMLNMKLRRPHTTATIWSSGKITCTGSTSEDEAKLAARRIARRLQKLGFNIRFSSYRVVNVLGTCSLPFGIKLNQFSEAHRANASYEPELHPGVTYRIKEPKATLKIFSTGSITVTAPCVLNVQLAIEHIYPLVNMFKMEPRKIDKKIILAERKYLKKTGTTLPHPLLKIPDDIDDEEFSDEMDDEDFSDECDSDVSQD